MLLPSAPLPECPPPPPRPHGSSSASCPWAANLDVQTPPQPFFPALFFPEDFLFLCIVHFICLSFRYLLLGPLLFFTSQYLLEITLYRVTEILFCFVFISAWDLIVYICHKLFSQFPMAEH